jgi:hypothetical protein
MRDATYYSRLAFGAAFGESAWRGAVRRGDRSGSTYVGDDGSLRPMSRGPRADLSCGYCSWLRSRGVWLGGPAGRPARHREEGRLDECSRLA